MGDRLRSWIQIQLRGWVEASCKFWCDGHRSDLHLKLRCSNAKTHFVYWLLPAANVCMRRCVWWPWPLLSWSIIFRALSSASEFSVSVKALKLIINTMWMTGFLCLPLSYRPGWLARKKLNSANPFIHKRNSLFSQCISRSSWECASLAGMDQEQWHPQIDLLNHRDLVSLQFLGPSPMIMIFTTVWGSHDSQGVVFY